MKKLGVLVMPLMAISLLVNCGGKPTPTEDVEFSIQESQVVLDNDNKAVIHLDWTPNDHAIEYSAFTFTLKNSSSITATVTAKEASARPLELTVAFSSALSQDDVGDLKFHYNDKTAKKEGEGEITNISVKGSVTLYHISVLTDGADIEDKDLPTDKDYESTINVTAEDKILNGLTSVTLKDSNTDITQYCTYTPTGDISASLKIPLMYLTNDIEVEVSVIDDPGPRYPLHASCINGDISSERPAYYENQNVTFRVNANEGLVLPPSVDYFTEVRGIDPSKITYTVEHSVNAVVTFIMPANEVTITITAYNPTPTAHLLSARCTNGVIRGNKIIYEPNEDVGLTFQPYEGYLLPKSKEEIRFVNIDVSTVTYNNKTGTLNFKMPNVSALVEINFTKVWYLDEEYIDSLDEDDIGLEQTITVNGVDHTVRLIGIDHDNLALSSGKAHTTWEFVDLLSDSSGYSLATVWDWEDGSSSTNQDYLDSNLRKTFDGGGDGEICWYRKGQATSEQTQQTEYANKTVLDMLPNKLQEAIKEVKKPVATTSSYAVNDTYSTKVFPLSYQEMTETTASEAKAEGKTYAIYKDDGDTDANRIKHQVKWHDGAATVTTKITDGKYSADNYAGFNTTTEHWGSRYWLHSPNINVSNKAWHVFGEGGFVSDSAVYGNAYPVAPAFCLGEREWYLNQDYINSLTENDVGTAKQTLNVNGVDHQVQLIGVDHDDLADNSGKAHTTWEFANFLSDENGYSLATVWDWRQGKSSTNQDYLNSNLRKTFDGGGNGSLVWYRKGQATSEQTQQTKYADKTVLDMLPADLQGVIKEVKKPIATGSSYDVSTYNTKVFALSYREMSTSSSPYVEEEGSTYAFYRSATPNTIKHQVKYHEGAAPDCTKITDCSYEANNWAGFNSLAINEGGHSWVRSPCANYTTIEGEKIINIPWWVRCDGLITDVENLVYISALALAPAFCI